MKVNNMKCIGAFSPSVSVQTGENIPGNVYTEDNLIAGNDIEIVEVLPEGGIDNHTLACWHFDGNNNNEVSSSPFLAYGSAEYGDIATKFNGYASNVVFKTIQPVSVKALTIDFWVKITTTFSPFVLTDYLPLDYTLKFVSPKLNLENRSGPQTLIEPTKEINVNEWHHIALVYTLSGVNYFIDGELQGTHEYSLSDITIVSNKDIMQMKPYGKIDELRISDIARPLNPDGKFPVPTRPYSVAVPTGKKQINFTGEITDMSSLVTKEELTTVTNQIGDQVSGIETKIPETATSENQLVTKSQMDEAIAGAGSGGSGTSDYSALTNKPQINSVELSGNKTLSDLGIQPAGSYATTAQLTSKVDSSSLSEVALTGSYNDLVDTPVIPEAYTLPVATSSSLGGVKPDGTTITATEDGTISAVTPSIDLPSDVYTQSNLLAGKGIEIIDEPVEGGIDNHTLACLHFDGDTNNAAGDNLKLNYPNSWESTTSNPKFGTGKLNTSAVLDISKYNLTDKKSFTLDFWLDKPESTPEIYFGLASGTGGYGYAPTREATFIIWYNFAVHNNLWVKNSTGEKIVDVPAIENWNTGTYKHFALTYDGTEGKASFFIDGILKTSVTFESTVNENLTSLYIYSSDEVRLSDIVRYTENFVPPTKPYSLAVPTGNKVVNNTITKTSQLTNDSGFITDVPVATTTVAGTVKPDGTSITINETGTISTVNTVQSTTINNIVKLTQAEYDALVTKDQNTLYYIVG